MVRTIRTLAWLLALHAAVSGSQGRGVTRYTVLLKGSRSGFETSVANPGGRLQLDWEYNDRGWGPKIHEEIDLDQSGLPTRLEVSGRDYLNAPVREQFSTKEGRARAGKSFYVSASGVPEETAVLARALLAAGGRLPLLPDGVAAIEKRGDLSIEAQGRSRTVVQYAITGLDIGPSPIWLDTDGKFFGVVNESGITVVLEGWESAVGMLAEAQEELTHRRSARLAETLAHRPSGPLAFIHANLFDSATATVHPDSTVVIQGERIAAVGRDGTIAVPRGSQVIDATGRTLLPGLWDMHAHVQANEGLLALAAGVTSVRDLDSDVDQLLRMRDHFEQGTEIGPRVLMVGGVEGRSPYAEPTNVFADSEAEARDAIDRYAKLGYVEIKIDGSVKPQMVPKIIELAKLHGLRVSGHVPAHMNAKQLVHDGVDEIHQIHFIFLNFMPDIEDTRTPACVRAVAARGGRIGADSGLMAALIRSFREHMTVLDPTLNLYEVMLTAGGLEVPKGMEGHYQATLRQMLKVTKAFSDAGVRIVAGSGALAGCSLNRELELYEQAGIPSAQVLQLATLGAARVMKRDYWYGSIVPGKFADMILVDGDPSRHVSDIRRVRTVVKNGIVYQASELYQALGAASLGRMSRSRKPLQSTAPRPGAP